MGKRPLLWLLFGLIFGIMAWNSFLRHKDIKDVDRISGSVLGKVEEIRQKEDKRTLVVSEVQCQNKSIVCNKIIAYDNQKNPQFSQLKIGNVVSIKGSISSFSLPDNPGQFNEYEYYQQQNIEYAMFTTSIVIIKPTVSLYKQTLFEFRKIMFESIKKCLNKDEAGTLSAMILGEKAMLSEDTKTLYQQNGIAHLLVISGLHVSILGAGVFLFLRKWVVSADVAAICAILFLFMYGELTGFSVATARAVIMMSIMLLARLLGRSYDGLSALSFGAILTLVQNPLALFSAGFLLSYGTVFAIIVGHPMWKKLFRQKQLEASKGKLFGPIWEGVIGSLGVYIVTLPIMIYFFYEVSVYGIFVNVLIMPFEAVLAVIGFLGGLIGIISGFLGSFFLGTAHFILVYYHFICDQFGNMPNNRWLYGEISLWKMAVYYGALCLLYLTYMIWEKKSGIIFLLGLMVIFIPNETKEFEYTMLDVGQGDGIYFKIANQNMLIDGGSSNVAQVGKYRIVPFLKSKGIGQLEYVFLTHSDQDHINGVLEMIEEEKTLRVEIKKVVLPDINNPDAAYHKIEQLCRKQGIVVKKMKAGDRIDFGVGKILACNPQSGKEEMDGNNNSLVLRISVDTLKMKESFKILSMADAGVEVEPDILRQAGTVDVLKVGHHGSKNASSEELLKGVHAFYGLISVGEKNHYGHPSEETIKRLKGAGMKILETKDKGAISFFLEEGRMKWKSFR